MPTYATLFAHTDHEKQNIGTYPTEVFSLAQELVEEPVEKWKLSIKVVWANTTGLPSPTFPMGSNDIDSPSNERVHTLRGYEVFDVENYFEIIEDTTR